ncbi:MAG: DegV family protein [Christensenellaceae bacterium]|nr:DegV family protein [Christensenellaceae bacterium]
MPYIYMTDSNSDIPFRFVDEYNIPIVFMPYVLDGEEFYPDLGRGEDQKAFFDKMRAGAVPVTSLLPKASYIDYFEPILKAGNDLLFVAFSSQLSATINNIYEARKELLEKYPERRFEVVDTLSISAPQTLLILESNRLYREGADMDTVIKWLEDNKQKSSVYFTVEDLVYLKRGGRISSVAAIMGSVLDLKPIIGINAEGKLEPVEKIMGRKKALRSIANHVVENIENPESQEILIIHADAIEDAERVENMIREKLPTLKGVMVEMVGPVIGTHCGPGTIGVAFMGKERQKIN